MELARRLDGMFAFAIWDERRERLVLGRDRARQEAAVLLVGRRPPGLRQRDQGAARRSRRSRAGSTRAPSPPTSPSATCRRRARSSTGVRSLPPGHVLTFEPGGEPVVERYWEPPVAGRRRRDATLDGSLDDAAPRGSPAARGGRPAPARLRRAAGRVPERRHRLERGRGDHGRRARPPGPDLHHRLRRPRRLRRATVRARSSPSGTRTDHHEFVVQPDAVDLVERLVWHHDQPFGDSSAIPTFLLSEVTRRHVTVALSGDGGDELFAGYERFAAGLAARRYAALPGVVQHGRQGRARPPAGREPPRPRGQPAAVRARRRARAARRLPLVDQLRPRRRARRRCSTDAATTGASRTTARSGGVPQGARTLDRLLDLNLRTYLPRRPAREGRPDEHGARPRGALAVPGHRAARATRPGLHPRLKARGLSLKRVLKAAVADLLPAGDHAPRQARLRRSARPLVPRGPARRTSARRSGRPMRASGTPRAGGARTGPRRARRGRTKPRPRAVDAADAGGVPAARGLVTDDRVVPSRAVHLLPVARRSTRPQPGRGVPRGARPSADTRSTC